ncbi:hypothetical protein PENTCL1PPCAC_10803, partial [Pristionchus entomophagus]
LIQMESHEREVVLHLVSIWQFTSAPEYGRCGEQDAFVSLIGNTLEECLLPEGIVVLEGGRRARSHVQRPVT